MNSSTKFAPTATLVAILGYLTWAGLELAPSGAAPSSAQAEIAASQLRPKAPDETKRDPFGSSVRFELGATHKPQSGPRKLGVTTAAAEPDAAPRAAGSGAPSRPATVPVETRTAAKIETVKPPTDLVLNATLLHGNTQIALINGRAYRPGEPVEGAASGTPLTISEIYHHHVVLAGQGKRMDLNYSDQSADARPAAANRPVGGPAKPKPGRPSAPPRQ